jgi:hypothetical protein
VEDNLNIIAPSKPEPRKDWGKHFKKMHEAGDDKLIMPERLALSSEGWEW